MENSMDVGLVGEFRCVITGEDGQIQIDTGYQKNLILNQGLEFFGGSSSGSSFNECCVVGSGNSTPTITQTHLDNALKVSAAGSDLTYSFSYIDDGSGYYKIWEQKKYRFTDLNNVNITEVGLVSSLSDTSNYNLTTRALIKDTLGNPTSITIKTGETLDIYYKIHKVIDTSDKSFVINMLDGDGGSIPYNVVARPLIVGDANWYRGLSRAVAAPYKGTMAYTTSELSEFTSRPTEGTNSDDYLSSMLPYAPSSYKRTLVVNFNLAMGDLTIRTLLSSWGTTSAFEFMPFQIRYGSVADDSPIIKTSMDTLSIPIEFSWGRYEGEI